MHSRRLAALVLGAWLAGSLFMIGVATSNFKIVGNILKEPPPPARAQIEGLTEDGARMLLRLVASEQNRFFFHAWETAQIGLGAALALTLLFATNGHRVVMGLSLAMLALVIVTHFLLTPEITALGRVIDYVPADRQTEERVLFWKYHNVYSGTELVKLALGFLLAVWLLKSRGDGRRSRPVKLDPVDHADHGHVDG